MKAAILYSEKMKEYDLGHVLTGERYENFMRLFRDILGGNPDFEIIEPSNATDAELKLVHTEDYIRRVDRCESKDPHDTPLSPGLVRAAKLLAGAGKLAGELIVSGRFDKAFVIGGGVQHARRDHEKGFGIFSDVGLCAENLMLNHGINRILILDVDAHASDGIYHIFCQEPRVLHISIHQNPRTLYPGKGFVDEIGEGDGAGYSVNIPLPPWTSDTAYQYVLRSIFVPLAKEFKPEIIMMIDGSDTHFTDRITQMGLTLKGIKVIGNIVKETAEELCEGKVIDFVGSGYSYDSRVVALGWLASLAGVTGVKIELEEPVPVPDELKKDLRLKETEEIVEFAKIYLGKYWECLVA
ncbi:MAG TPA: hypothetical protein G4N93_04230 [Dehalococcoidia bacterium]|nr:hypothetical protein [Dehalococcoidia bacterium]